MYNVEILVVHEVTDQFVSLMDKKIKVLRKGKYYELYVN